MTEKRFEIMDGIDKDRYTGIWDEHGENDELCVSEIVNLLNVFNDENKQLRLELDTHKHPLWSTREAEKIINELKQENEQLKRFFIIQQNNFTKEDELKITVREELYNLCNKINNKMKEVYIKTPNTCYIDYKNQLYGLLKKMDTSIESFKRDY